MRIARVSDEAMFEKGRVLIYELADHILALIARLPASRSQSVVVVADTRHEPAASVSRPSPS